MLRKVVQAILCVVVAAVGILGAARAQNAAYPEIAGMSLVPAGDFWMGRVHFFAMHEYGFLARDRLDDFPAHLVSLDAFYIDKYEVTNSAYKLFAAETKRETPWDWPAGNILKGEERLPVTNVSWEDASAYCKWAGKRLPTEAEWEKAARGGLDRKMFPWGDTGIKITGDGPTTPTRQRAHFKSGNGPAAVGQYPVNGYGLYDMIGNVWEWTADWYFRDYYSVSPDKNPAGPQSGKYRVIRGGGWGSDPDENLLNNFRNYTDPEMKSPTIGFRCARSAPPAIAK
jgi:formylglycine-generating enzyme required for sulfatase activity